MTKTERFNKAIATYGKTNWVFQDVVGGCALYSKADWSYEEAKADFEAENEDLKQSLLRRGKLPRE